VDDQVNRGDSHPEREATRGFEHAVSAGVAAVFLGLIFIAMTLAVEVRVLTGADRQAELLVHAGVSRELYGLMAALTFVGDSGSIAVVTFVCVVSYLRSGEYLAAALVAACPTGASILDLVLKNFFQRARPHLWSSATIIHSYSFPSGHATISSAFFAGISYVTWKLYGARVGAPMCAVCTLLTVGIGFSRVYLGVHWPSDVLAGFSLGLGWALLVIAAVESWRVRAGTATAEIVKPPRKAPREHRYSKM
jgi:membrane-associated phospholipid phosphatase